MARTFSPTDPTIVKLVDQQLRNWELARRQRYAEPEKKRPEVEDFVCISRQVGADDVAVGTALGRRLGWPVFGRELLEAMAGDDQLRRQIYASMDQRDLTWWESALRPLLQRGFVKDDYFPRLCRTLLSLARQGSSVFVGRGADLVLPQDRGLRVRLVAPEAVRVERFARTKKLSASEAKREIGRVERERSAFFRHHFKVEAADPTRHDLTINLGRYDVEEAVELILRARELRLARS